MAEKQTGADNEPCQQELLCPLCKARKLCISHLTEHLKKFHKPLTELDPYSKRDDRLRLSPKQKEELTKAVPKNRYKSTEYKYSLIQNIVTPKSPMPADNAPPPADEGQAKPLTPIPQLSNLQEYFDGHTEATLNMLMGLEENEKEAVLQHFEGLLVILRRTVEGATGTGSPHHFVPVLTAPMPTLLSPFPILDHLIPGPVAPEASFCPPSSCNQNYTAPGPAIERQSPEWLASSLLDPKFSEEED